MSPGARLDLILQDLEFVETRSDENPPDEERAVLEKTKACLESDQMISAGPGRVHVQRKVAMTRHCEFHEWTSEVTPRQSAPTARLRNVTCRKPSQTRC